MNLKKIALYSSVFALQGLSNAVIPVLPELAGGDNGGSAISSLLFSGYFMGALLALVPLGILADRIGNLKVIRFGILLTALSGFFIAFSDIPWILGISRFLEGVGCGAFFPAAFSIIAEWEDSQQSLGEFNFLLNAGLAAGVFFSGVLAGFGIKTAIVSFAFLAGLSCILLLSGVGGLLSPNRKEKKFALPESDNPVRNQKDTYLLPELKSYLEKARIIMFKTNFGKIWGTSILLYGTTGLLTANYADYSAGFLTKPELGLWMTGRTWKPSSRKMSDQPGVDERRFAGSGGTGGRAARPGNEQIQRYHGVTYPLPVELLTSLESVGADVGVRTCAVFRHELFLWAWREYSTFHHGVGVGVAPGVGVGAGVSSG